MTVTGTPIVSAEPRQLRTEAEQALIAGFEAASSRLPGNAAVKMRRAAAIDAIRRTGLPHRRVEEWKYTDLRALMRHAAPPAIGPASDAAVRDMLGVEPLEGLDRARIVIADGVYRADLSDVIGLDGVTVTSLAEALGAGDHRVGALFEDGMDAVLALNSAYMSGGVVISIAPGAAIGEPIELAHVATGREPAAVAVRNIVVVGAGASARIVESHRSPAGVAHQLNIVTELTLGDGAKLSWAKVEAEGDAALHLGSLVARIGGDAAFKHLTVTKGAAISRTQHFIKIAGEGSDIGVYGTTMIGGRQHSDFALVIEHLLPRSKSRVLVKTVADDSAEGAFQGRIVVHPDAQKTDGKMMMRSLVLSDDASFAAKPELEIYADDVQCGHGATAGQIDQDMLFYLSARGIPRGEAERLLITAFLAEAIEAIGDEDLVAALEPIVDGWLAKRSAGAKA